MVQIKSCVCMCVCVRVPPCISTHTVPRSNFNISVQITLSYCTHLKILCCAPMKGLGDDKNLYVTLSPTVSEMTDCVKNIFFFCTSRACVRIHEYSIWSLFPLSTSHVHLEHKAMSWQYVTQRHMHFMELLKKLHTPYWREGVLPQSS